MRTWIRRIGAPSAAAGCLVAALCLVGCGGVGGGGAVAPGSGGASGATDTSDTAQAAEVGGKTDESDVAPGGGGGRIGGSGSGGAKTTFAVHEWGTFTSMQGSDGGTLEGMHHEDEPLPYFVHGRSIGSPNAKAMESLPEPVTQKMETPVLYFHSAEARDVQVRVDFPKGIISQWYPQAAAQAPAVGAMQGIRDGSMTWKVRVDPAFDRDAVPQVDADDIWAPSREVDVPALEAGGERERFVFYRGLGRFELPIRITSDSALHIRNDGELDVPNAWLLLSTPTGGAMVELGALPAGSTRDVAIPTANSGVDALISAAAAALQQGLVASGLTAQESAAMVGTWTRSWFQTRGLRVLYVLPRAWTDALLPIAIEPAPDALVRTLVGRIEILTPAVEQQLVAAVQAVHDGASYDAIAEQGRFLEAKILRVQALVQDSPLVATCKQLLDWTSGQP